MADEREAHGVVVGFDGSNRARSAVWWAVDEARRRDCRLSLVQAHAVPVPTVGYGWGPVVVPGGMAAASTHGPALLDDDRVRQQTEQALTALAEECRSRAPGLAVDTAVQDGRPASVLSTVADERDAQLVVVGATGLSALPRALLGSTAAELLHEAERPVVVVRGDQTDDLGRPLDIPVDLPVILGTGGTGGTGGTEAGDRAVGFAFDFASRHACPLLVVHAWSDSPLDMLASLGMRLGANAGEVATRIDDYVLAPWRQRYPHVPVTIDIVDDRPAHALLERAEHARLLVVGSRGRGPVRRTLLGSVSHAAVYHAPCPVAVAP